MSRSQLNYWKNVGWSVMDKKRIPFNGTFELTGRCNLGCKMCLVRVDNKRIEELGLRERTAKEWIQMAEQVRDAGTIGLLLTGGEVMLRPDFCEIYEAIAQMGFLLTVYTNATMVTDKVMNLFRKYPPHKIGVTMYGASNETYEKLCGCPDGYDRFVSGVRQLATLPSLFETRTTIVQDNLADLQAMKEFTKREFGEDKTLTISRFVTKSIRGGIACAEQCRLTPEQNVEMINQGIVELWRKVQKGEIELPPDREKFQMHRIPQEEGEYLFKNCDAGINSYSINWSGNMYACELLDQGCTKPFEDGFEKAWKELPNQYPTSHIIEQCDNCEYVGLCGTCPANRLSETGDWFGVSEYSCKEAECFHGILKKLQII